MTEIKGPKTSESPTSPGQYGTDSPILTHGTRPWHDLDAMPGEFVLRFEHRDSGFYDDCHLEFGVKRVVPTNTEDHQGVPYFTASTPYRALVATGDTEASALSGLLHWISEISRNGSFNPKYPAECGDPPIQHVLGILSERLQWQIERRHEHLGKADPEPARIEDESNEIRDAYLANVQRDNDIIMAISTSIAALARVKDL